MTPGVFDALRDSGFERLAFVSDARGERVVAAKTDEDEAPVDDASPAPVREAARVVAEAAVAAGDVRRLECAYRRDVGLRVVFARRKDDATRALGPVRRIDLAVPEARVLREACTAARHAALSCGVADLHRGGAAFFLHATPAPEHDRSRFAQALAEETLLLGADFWLDAGVGDDWAREAQKRGSPIFGTKAPPCAETAALGAAAVVCAALGAVGPRSDDLPPIIVLQGLGRVGAAVGRRLAADGYRLVVSDKEYAKIDAFLGRLEPPERKNVSVVAPYQIVEVASKADACDVFCPAAEGSVLGAEAAAKLKCRAVAGPATGVFDAASLADETALAETLDARGVLYVPEWVAGLGGAVHAALESGEKSGRFDVRTAEARTERAAGWAADEAIMEAKRAGRAPFQVLLRRAGIAGH